MFAKTIKTRDDRDEAIAAVRDIRAEPQMHVQIVEASELPDVAKYAREIFGCDFVLIGDISLPENFPAPSNWIPKQSKKGSR